MEKDVNIYMEGFEEKKEDPNKTAFDKLSDFVELDKADKSYRDTFLKLLDEVVEEEIEELSKK